MSDLDRVQKIIHFTFRNQTLLEEALLHTSYVNENTGYPIPHNERLEFLGDAFLGFVVARRLHALTPSLSEGQMTQVRAALVCMDTLARIAQSLGLGEFLILGKGEEKSGGRQRESNLGRVVEAIIGAAVIDGGVTRATGMVDRLLRREWRKLLHKGLPPDYKSQFQAQAQGQGSPPPRYRVVEVTGPAHHRRYTVEVRVGDQVYGKGEGMRKKDAEAAAARQGISKLRRKSRSAKQS
jgi:ribonuclease-3